LYIPPKWANHVNDVIERVADVKNEGVVTKSVTREIPLLELQNVRVVAFPHHNKSFKQHNRLEDSSQNPVMVL